jgi:hypothetical protein
MRIKGIVTFQRCGFVLNKTKKGPVESLFIRALLLGFITFMLNDQTMDYLTTFLLSVLFQIILFSSFILILILK